MMLRIDMMMLMATILMKRLSSFKSVSLSRYGVSKDKDGRDNNNNYYYYYYYYN